MPSERAPLRRPNSATLAVYFQRSLTLDFNTLLWGAFLLFMVVCCGMMMRMMMKRPPTDKSRGTDPLRDDANEASLVSKPDKEKQ